MTSIVIYASWYGDTRAIAEAIVDGLSQTSAAPVIVRSIRSTNAAEAARCELIVLGGPNHFGTATRAVKSFLRQLGRTRARGQRLAFFDTCLAGEEGKATRAMERLARDVWPTATVLQPSHSAVVVAMKGPLREGELARARSFGLGTGGGERAISAPLAASALPPTGPGFASPAGTA